MNWRLKSNFYYIFKGTDKTLKEQISDDMQKPRLRLRFSRFVFLSTIIETWHTFNVQRIERQPLWETGLRGRNDKLPITNNKKGNINLMRFDMMWKSCGGKYKNIWVKNVKFEVGCKNIFKENERLNNVNCFLRYILCQYFSSIIKH